MAPRPASTYRAARRNAARGEVWGAPHHYYRGKAPVIRRTLYRAPAARRAFNRGHQLATQQMVKLGHAGPLARFVSAILPAMAARFVHTPRKS